MPALETISAKLLNIFLFSMEIIEVNQIIESRKITQARKVSVLVFIRFRRGRIGALREMWLNLLFKMTYLCKEQRILESFRKNQTFLTNRNGIRKNIFSYLFSFHNTISLSSHEQVCLSRILLSSSGNVNDYINVLHT